MLAVLRHALWRRRTSLAWWALGLVAVTGLLAVAYPTVRDNAELDKTFSGLSPSVQALLGLSSGLSLTSPAGYLNSQFFANILPVMLLVFAVGVAAWTVAGDEAAGTLELLLANPVGRARVAVARAGALALLVAGLTAISALALAAMAPAVGLDQGLPALRMVQATVASGALALAFAAVAFAVGAATGSRPAALGAAATLAVFGFVIEGLAEQVRALRPIRAASPWHWLLGSDPLQHGLAWRAWALPVATSVLLVLLGTICFTRRDLH
ncbi:MAG TPA: ABC transporter permease subunit [Actinomycetes bacterium]|jgi:ABC-2 type transport system permease protein|nr:ABC transporter permease subunit [Actinomycetes bacterium]